MTLPVSSDASARAWLRPAAVRPASASTRSVAERRAHSLAASWTRRGAPRLARSSSAAGMSLPGGA